MLDFGAIYPDEEDISMTTVNFWRVVNLNLKTLPEAAPFFY